MTPLPNDHDLLVELNTKTGYISHMLEAHLATHCTFDRRLTSVEKWQWQAMGVLGILVFLINLLFRVWPAGR